MTYSEDLTADDVDFRIDYLDPIPLPWGWDLIDDIPLPPFRDRIEYEDFMRWLHQHIALIDQGIPSMSTMVLNHLLERGAGRFRPSDRNIHLTATELAAAFMTNFPAPWTVDTLAPALTAAGMPMSQDARGTWSIAGEDRICARKVGDNAWQTTVYVSPGRRRTTLDAQEFVVFLMQQFLWKDYGGLPCPVGWGVIPSELQALIPNVTAARLKFAHDVLSPAHLRWMQNHTIAHTLSSEAIDKRSEDEMRRMRAVAEAGAREQLAADTRAETAATN